MSIDNPPSISAVYAADAIVRTASSERVRTSAASDEAVTVDTTPSAPPPEVMHAVQDAARVYDQLKAGGRELRFNIENTTGRMSVEVHDLRGNVIRTLSPSEALAVAEGAPLS